MAGAGLSKWLVLELVGMGIAEDREVMGSVGGICESSTAVLSTCLEQSNIMSR